MPHFVQTKTFFDSYASKNAIKQYGVEGGPKMSQKLFPNEIFESLHDPRPRALFSAHYYTNQGRRTRGAIFDYWLY